MSCKYQEKLALLVFAEIEGEEKKSIIAHLETCKTCQKNYQELQTTANLLKDGFANQGNLSLNDSHRKALFEEVNSTNSKTALSISKKIFYAIAAIVAISVAATLHQYIDKNNKTTIAKTTEALAKSKSISSKKTKFDKKELKDKKLTESCKRGLYCPASQSITLQPILKDKQKGEISLKNEQLAKHSNIKRMSKKGRRNRKTNGIQKNR